MLKFASTVCLGALMVWGLSGLADVLGYETWMAMVVDFASVFAVFYVAQRAVNLWCECWSEQAAAEYDEMMERLGVKNPPRSD